MPFTSASIHLLTARLKNSSPAEIFYRVRQQVFWRAAPALQSFTPPEGEIDSIPLIPEATGDIPSEMVDAILSSLHFGPVSEGNGTADIRSIWEAGRLQHLTVLLHAMRKAGDDRAEDIRKFVGRALLKWLMDNPFPRGPHYLCAMECAMRIPLFLLALRMLVTLRAEERGAIIQGVFYHAWLIRNRLSLYSSLGNHTVAECVGLVMAGALFARKKCGSEWLRTGIRLLEQEANHQILQDGGPAEQSINYHRMVLDLYWLAVGFLEANNLHDCSVLRNRLSKGEDFIHALGEPLPSIGDSDDGFAVAPVLHPAWRPAGNGARKKEVSEGGLQAFADTGLSVLRFAGDTRLTFDHGPLGMAPLYNHGHADALSITLSVNGKPLLVDPGTYRYNGAGPYRSYFKSTRAHNTVAIDGEDQAVQVTGFIWEKPYRIIDFKKEWNDGKGFIFAGHDGYSRLRAPVLHNRMITVNDSTSILIEDRFQGRGVHSFELNYHLHPDVKVTLAASGREAVLESGGSRVELQILEGKMDIVKGHASPLLGWYSPSYGKLEKTSVLHCEQRGRPDQVRFTTRISLSLIREDPSNPCPSEIINL